MHFDAIADHVECTTEPVDIWVYLPDNPSNRSKKDMTFTKKTEAIRYLWWEYMNLHYLIESIAHDIGFQVRPITQEIKFGPEGHITPGAKRTMALQIIDPAVMSALLYGHTEDQRVYAQGFQRFPGNIES